MKLDFPLLPETVSWLDLVAPTAGVIIGALISGIVAFRVAKWQAVNTERKENERREEEERAAAFKLFAKLSMILNGLISLVMQIDEMQTREVAPDDPAPNQRKISAFANISLDDAPLFSSDELYLLVKMKETDFLTDLDLLARRYRSFIGGLLTYGERKKVLHELMSAEPMVFGSDATVYTPKDSPNAQKLHLEAMTLETVISPLVETAQQDAKLAVKIAQQFGPKMKGYFGEGQVPAFNLGNLDELKPELFD